MQPITFQCVELLPQSPPEIAAQILDLDKWPEFQGYGPLPGIASAEFEVRTPQVVGTRIHVTNTDGSCHVEEIREWNPTHRLHMQMSEFTPPLSRFAIGFDEVFEFEVSDGQTRLARSFQIHPRSVWTKPVLWVISLFLRRAIAAHLRQMRAQSED